MYDDELYEDHDKKEWLTEEKENQESDDESWDEDETEEVEESTEKPEEKDTTNHYVDNKEFFAAMKEWKAQVIEAEESDEQKPPITEYIGECFVKIAEHLSYRPNFMNYPFREEMIGDGIENCLMYAHNFDPEKSKNPFSYFTQIIYYAFLRRIQKEKKQNYVKYRVMQSKDHDGKFKHLYRENYFEDTPKDPYAKMLNLSETDIENFSPKKKKKRKTTKGDSRGSSLDSFLEGNDENSNN